MRRSKGALTLLDLRAIRAAVGSAAGVLAATAAVAMLAFRYANLCRVPFILDEPQFVGAAREQIRTGHWLNVSPLVGNQGVRYGPTVLWFYGVVHGLFGGDPLVHVFAMLTCMTMAHAIFAFGVARRFGTPVGVAALAFVASSPYQFFWSRLAWDQTVNVCAGFIAFAFCAFRRITPTVAVLVGLVAGFALSSHLMSVPLVALTFAFVAIASFNERDGRPLPCAIGAALAVNVPYFRYLLPHWREAQSASRVDWALLPGYALEPARVASLSGIEYFFDDSWSSFLGENPAWALRRGAISGLPWVLALAAAVGLVVTVWRGGRVRRRVCAFALASWTGYALFFAERRLPLHPHYQFGAWWVIPLGLAAGLRAAADRSGLAGRALLAGLWVISVLQFQFTRDWMDYVRRRVGTPGIHYGSPLEEQKAIVGALCRLDGFPILIFNRTRVFDQSLRYIASVDESCADRDLRFCALESCTATAGARQVDLIYEHAQSGRLAIHVHD